MIMCQSYLQLVKAVEGIDVLQHFLQELVQLVIVKLAVEIPHSASSGWVALFVQQVHSGSTPRTGTR